MLRSLDIRDMLIIDKLTLEFQPGLNVLTGETGAGKSILLDSLGFVLGWRGRAELVRQGAERGEVMAAFDLPPGHAARAILEDAGFEPCDELILRRINFKDGRKQAFVNDRRASGEVLRALSDTLIELHGQHDDRGLLNPKGHLAVLDGFAGTDLDGLRAAWRTYSAAQRALVAAQMELIEAQKEEEFLRHAVSELEALDPQKGEEEQLDTRRRMMQAGERIREDIVKALAALGGEGADGNLRDATRWLEGVADSAEGQLDRPLQGLERTITELGEVVDGVEASLSAMQFDPRELENTEERLFTLRGLARKHNVLPDELGELCHELRDKLDAIDGGADHLSTLEKAVSDAREIYEKCAQDAHLKREKSAKALDAAMSKELAPLKMERAVFTTELRQTDPGPMGTDEVSFSVATNPGAPSGPLNKIASGGELSRFLLALKVCLSDGASGVTMIFDEIDRGVGGATADAVGRRLAEIAREAQVLVVTHSPQVAALGGHHWRVEKKVSAGATISTVAPLDASERVDEIARMVAGDTVTDAARDAARALLNG